MANITSLIQNIRNAAKGLLVRSSIADGIEAINIEIESTTTKQNNLKSQFDSLVINSGNSNAEIVAGRTSNVTGQTSDTIGHRLDGVDLFLNEKAKQIDVNNALALKRDKNIPINEFDCSDSLKQIFNGNAPILQTVADKIISRRKTDFINSSNLFDKNNVVNGYLSAANGTIIVDTNYRTSDLIKVSQGDVLNFPSNIAGYCFYDSNMVFKSGTTGVSVKTLTVPAGSYYIRFYFWYTLLDTLMCFVNKPVPIVYTPYSPKMDSDIIPDIIVKPESAAFIKSLNIFNKNNAVSGHLSNVDGSIVADSNYRVSDFMGVVPNDTMNFSSSVAGYCFYDKNKAFIIGTTGVSINTLVVPSNAYYVRIYIYYTLLDTFMCVINGLVPTDYVAYALKIDNSLLPESLVNSVFKPKLNLPPKLYVIKDQILNVYFENIISKSKKYDIDVVCDKGIQYDKNYGLTSDFDGNVPITINVYENENLLVSAASTIYSKLATNGTGTKKCLFIGDSITDFGTYTQNLLDLFVGDTVGIQLLGTRGTGANKHEGRAGWSAYTYNNVASQVDWQSTLVNNAFWNPSTSQFDFSYYMTQQGYTGVDYVFIELGTNDIFNFNTISEAAAGIPTILANFDKMVNSIKAYNSSTKVCIMLTIPPNQSQDKFGISYGCGRTQWRFKAVYDLWVSELIKKYKDMEAQNIYPVPVNTNIDCLNHINDAVHPTTPDGFMEMAKPLRYFIKNTVA